MPVNSKNSKPNVKAKPEVVISGLSGRFPESSNVEEFKNNLYENIDMVNDDERRWPSGVYGLPSRSGKIKNCNLESFDHTFFNVHEKQAENMDPQLRAILELTYEAIVDAGINPNEMRGSNTGVYVAIAGSESEFVYIHDHELINGYGLIGHTKSMFANRISYTFDFKGPSYSMDTACSSAASAITNAFLDIQSGRIDAAIVAGVNLTLLPVFSLQFQRLNMLSKEGKCKSFDETGDGYVRAEAFVSIFLQKASDARRVYATILNSKINTDGYKVEGITFPDRYMQNQLIEQSFEEINLDPMEVEYVEAHGTGTAVGDPQEVNSIADFFCKGRKTPLLIGAVKSNMGHAEPASALCSIAKILLIMETGIIPANLNFKNPNPEITAIVQGALKVVDENTKWDGGLIAMNSFGFGGANCHIIFKPNLKIKSKSLAKDETHRLVVVSGRTQEAVQVLLEDAEIHKDDDEFLALINEVHMKPINLHPYRGYTVLTNHALITREVLEFKKTRPIWFVYSGMGSQWSKMAKDFMNFSVFKNAINKCATVLKPEGIDLLPIILEGEDSIFDNILYSFIGIAACQIALTDLLFSLNIYPNGLLGHSVGEIGCAYADGCFTAEQTILASYWRGKSIIDTRLINGKMASVGLSLDECRKILPPDVLLVCHNNRDNVTISGPADSMDKLIEKLCSEGIFAKMIKSSGYAFHSKYIAEAGPKLLENLNKIIPNPKKRSSKWISTSIPKTAWNTAIAQESSAAYHVNNLLSPVLFYEGLLEVPENAICIEIAPHGLLQAILRRALPPNCTNISLAQQNHKNNAEFFLTSIGKLYASGLNPSVMKLFPPVSFPVSRGTPMLGSKVKWNHSIKWRYPKYEKGISGSKRSGRIKINLTNEDDSFLIGHKIDGRILYPATGYLTLAWNALAKVQNSDILHTAVIMENIIFHRATILSTDATVKLNISIFDGTGKFEICENDSLVVSGLIKLCENIHQETLNLDPIPIIESDILLNNNDIYKELRIRGYDYSGLFCGIVKANCEGTSGLVKWNDNWITYMDTILQFNILQNNIREIFLPTAIEKIVIDPGRHLDIIKHLSNKEKNLPIYAYPDINIMKSGGIEIKGLKATSTTRRINPILPTLEKYLFVPLEKNSLKNDKNYFIECFLKLIIENCDGALKIKTLELINQDDELENILSPTFIKIIESEPILLADASVIVNNIDINQLKSKIDDKCIKVITKNISESSIEQNAHVIFGSNILSRDDKEIVLQNIITSINMKGFILLNEHISVYKNKEIFKKLKLTIVQEQIVDNRIWILARRIQNINERKIIIIHLTEQNFKWLDGLKAALATAEANKSFVYLVSQNEELFGAVGLMNCIRNETGGKLARMYFIQDKGLENFNVNSKFYQDQLEKDLVMNIYKSGKWGTYRHIKVSSKVLPTEHCYVNTLVRGDMSSLNWFESPLLKNNNLDTDTELCSVYYSALNFRDVMFSTGKLGLDALPPSFVEEECILGLEFAGRDSKGKRVMGLAFKNAMATTISIQKQLLIEIPEKWTMEEASTIPCVYFTVYCALVICGRMKRGEKILIHCGAGGVGIAAINVALHHGLTVFTTVGNNSKRDFLTQLFPKLNQNHIGNSRDCSFEQMVLRETRGKGVDLVLNSLSEEKLQASLRCLGNNGRFLEIGKFDMTQNNPIGMSIFLRGVSVYGILLDQLASNDFEVFSEISELIREGIKNGAVQPLPTNVYDETDIESAFRYLATGKHIGKVILKIRDEEESDVYTGKPKLINAIPRTYFYSDKSYIIIGGLGGFGLELANWIILRGCRKLILSSRSGIKTGYQSLMVNKWLKKGVQVLIDQNDITTKYGCKKLIDNSKKIGPIGGIFNLGVVLRDNLIEDQTEKDFKEVCAAKIDGTKNLDILSRDMCPHLDYFVCFSSVSCGRGNIGQTNYGMANSTMERICEKRQLLGLPGKAIQWGAVGDTGLVIESLGNNDSVIGGTLPQRMLSCLATLDLFLQHPDPVMSSMIVVEKRKTDSSALSIVGIVSKIMGLKDVKNIQDNTSLVDLNMDSLMGTEIKQNLERNFDIFMTPQQIRNLTFGQLRNIDEKPDSSLPKIQENIDDFDQNIFIELIPNETLICLKYVSSAKKPIFIVHPVEGFANIFKCIAEHTNRSVYGFQSTLDAPLESAESLSQFYIKQLKLIQNEGPYLIAGYSFGALIAYIMTLQLEENGEEVELIMLDGAPKYVLWRVNNFRKLRNIPVNDHVNEALSLAYFSTTFANFDFTQIYESLMNVPDSNKKLEIICQLVNTKINKPIDVILSAINLFIKKLEMPYKYKSERKVKCDITLIKPIDNEVNTVEDYELSYVCERKVIVVTVKGNHKTFLTENESVIAIAERINSIKF